MLGAPRQYPAVIVFFESRYVPNVLAPGRARDAVGAFLEARLPEENVRDAQLMTNELVANSILHSGIGRCESIGLHVQTTAGYVRVEVDDQGPGFEYPTIPPTDDAGWGFLIVDGLSDRWGIVRADPCYVWFEIDR